MTIQCQVLFDNNVSPTACEFVSLPRLGETVFLEVAGKDISGVVLDVAHKAGGASQNRSPPFVMITISTDVRSQRLVEQAQLK